MEQKNQRIWIGEKDLTQDPGFMEIAEQEFSSNPILDHIADEEAAGKLQSSRRDFLKYLGFGVGAATIAAGCDIPVKRAIPYVIKPDEIVPGVANYYASSYVNGGDFCSILIKTREGRPIKIEGNDQSVVTFGGTSARAQAMVLSLYDTNRLRNPMKRNEGGNLDNASWEQLDKAVMDAIASAGSVKILSNTVLSPSTKRAFADMQAKYPSLEVVYYDPVSSAAILEANEMNFGDRVIPSYQFDKAEVIVSFNADFLGTWISPVEYAHQYAKMRKPDPKHPKMSRLYQVENHMSLTGSNADNRVLVKPTEQGAAIAHLYNYVTGNNISAPKLSDKAIKALKAAAEDLKAAAGKSLVISASNNTSEQVLVNAINYALGNIGTTVDFAHASLQRQGNEGDLDRLVTDMSSGKVDVLIINEANPVYDFAKGEAFANALSKVKLSVAMSQSVNETNSLCQWIAPTNHLLESWGDAEPKRGEIHFIQPAISPLFDTRQMEENIMRWSENTSYDASSDQPYYDYIKAHYTSMGVSWDKVLHNGVYMHTTDAVNPEGFSGDITAAANGITRPSGQNMEISFMETISGGNGQFAGNPWLMELPDPVTRTSWGNYLAVPVAFDGVRKMLSDGNVKDGDLVELTINGKTITVPVVQQFGQMPGTVSLALGYGRRMAGKCGTGVGVDVNEFVNMNNGRAHYYSTDVQLGNRMGKEKYYSSVQYHHTMGIKATDSKTGEKINADEAATVFFNYGMVRQGYQGSLTDRTIIFNSNIKDLESNIESLKEKRAHAQHLNDSQIYAGHDAKYDTGHHWGMHVDLNACIGCNACAIACMAENNVPVVGKKEVSRHHEMTWLRIDRYFYGELENPNTVYQPMMCQHCDNAPCENVCPVNATNHSSEGLNQMAYNRCVGTRYCANNCPYKVRRFNWMDYTTADIFPGNQMHVVGEQKDYGSDDLTRMVLNPDVTVRSRGVIEKCSFCVQRIQEGKLTAKTEGRRLSDNDVKTACQTACPTGAITFGDMNNKKGILTEKIESPLTYIALEEINVRSSVHYTMKVNNRDESLDA